MAVSPRTLRVEEIWGTAVGVDFRDRMESQVLDDVFDWFRRVDDLFSTWREDTEISRMASGELRLKDASPEVREVLRLCESVRDESRGAFDVTFAVHPSVEPRPGFAAIDPSGLVKGWALERAAEMIEASGGHNFTINAGGDVLTRGRPAPGTNCARRHPASVDACRRRCCGGRYGARCRDVRSLRARRTHHLTVDRTASERTDVGDGGRP